LSAASVIRSGRRRVVTPAVVAEPADAEEQTDASESTSDEAANAEVRAEASEPEVKATRVRNKNGASVLIYSGADLSQERGQATVRTSGIETSDTRRGNPLR
jgi:hypothetical protein